ncbi:MAG: signal peptidase I [Planctomycetes bacterium RBG_13_63_9]|nr:MAG: signal peptidase I [Planctomycetes bacterium RBG_13_63_9]
MPDASPAHRSRLRPLAEGLLLLSIAVLGLRTWCLQGLIVPCRVVSGSMATALLGSHRDVICADCAARFACAADPSHVAGRAVCPNCGHPADDLNVPPEVAGDGVLIQRSVFQFRRPRRWEVVAFRRRSQADRIHVKRVVGTPGESIEIRQGDVYVNGRITRKTLSQQRALAILVHDAEHRPTIEPAPPPRWRGRDPDGLWGSAEGRFAHPPAADGESIDWLEYRHWHRLPGKQHRIREGPIRDVCTYNQSQPRRDEDTNVVTDLLLSFRLVRTAGNGRLAIRVTDGWKEFQVWIDPSAHRYEVLQDGHPLADPGAVGKLPRLADGLMLEISLFDQQFLLALAGRPVLAWPYDRPEGAARPVSRPLAIGSEALEVLIDQVRVYRDVYYTHPIGVRGRWGLEEPVRLAAEEYFVLGDNSPVSEDSRTWPEGPAVLAKLLVGKPLLVCYPARVVDLGPWRFQVPDPRRIRYIR